MNIGFGASDNPTFYIDFETKFRRLEPTGVFKG